MNGSEGTVPLATIDLRELQDRDRARDAVRRAAAALLRVTRERFPDWSPPPFDPRFYARALDIPVSSHRLESWDALLIPTMDGFEIVVDTAARSEGRRRFSIAHELAHTFFADAEQTYRMRTTERERYPSAESLELERLCDEGAAELLMPREAFSAAVATHGWRGSAVPMLAERFCVSLDAAAIRFVEMSAAPCAVVFFRYALKPTRERAQEGASAGRAPQPRRGGVEPEPRRYRVARAHRAAGFPYLFPPGKSIARESVVYRAAIARRELEGVERVALGKVVHTVQISACPLPGGSPAEPPGVCALVRVGSGARAGAL